VSARNIDHLVLPVGNLAQARDRLSALGFTVAPDAHHPFGTANACVFFEDGTYLEPLALADRRKAGTAAKRGNVFTARDIAFRGRRGRQGLSAIVVDSSDAAGDHERFLARGISAGDPLEFARTMKSPHGDEAEARFRLAFAAVESSPDFFAFACQRMLTFPADVRELLAHANTVAGVKEVVLAGGSSPELASMLEEVLQAPAQAGEAGVSIATANGKVRLLDADQLVHDFGLSINSAASGLSAKAIIFRAVDLAVTEIILAANDVAFIRRDGRVLVSPAPGQGVLFGFEE
jgi:hypothetical protein